MIYPHLASLKTKEKQSIEEVHLLGGAIKNYCESKEGCSESVNWFELDICVTGKINNYFSDNDDAPKYLYTLGEGIKLDFDKPIGKLRTPKDAINNVNVCAHVNSHCS